MIDDGMDEILNMVPGNPEKNLKIKKPIAP